MSELQKVVSMLLGPYEPYPDITLEVSATWIMQTEIYGKSL